MKRVQSERLNGNGGMFGFPPVRGNWRREFYSKSNIEIVEPELEYLITLSRPLLERHSPATYIFKRMENYLKQQDLSSPSSFAVCTVSLLPTGVPKDGGGGFLFSIRFS
ncbi:hypothetical protein OUZ56_002265 [Daphnia magna]|uniref:Uncharacterized protein n=1 Tax=Daphnia magna TaxID=35525 RepID=A0ABR0A5K9_9CRUS|nr:hypothetical protein OUZ56_002265 [Daphnia magna]